MEETKKEVEPTGYIVAIKTDKKNVYKIMDIANMTNSEFADWLFSVYPYKFNSDQFESRLTRVKSLEYSLAFWQQKLFRERK
jgi:hypothetical protein